MENIYRRYKDNILLYKKIDNITFLPEDSDEKILQTLKDISEQKKRIQIQQNETLASLVPYEKGQEELTEERYLELQELADALHQGKDILDSAVSLRIHRLLLREAKKQQNYDRIAREIYGCGITEWTERRVEKRILRELTFHQIEEYIPYLGKMSKEGKTYALRSFLNRELDYSNGAPDKLLDFCTRELAYLDYLEHTYPDFATLYSQARQVTYQNMNTCFCGFREGKAVTPYYTLQALDAAQKALDNVLKKGSAGGARWYSLYAAQFHHGDITIDELLEKIDPLTHPSEECSQTENFNREFMVTAYYIEYLRLYSPKDKKEIAAIASKRAHEVLQYAVYLKNDEKNIQVDRWLLNFLQACSDAIPFEESRDIFFEVTVHRHIQTYIHTLVVKDISLLLLFYLIDHNPEAFAGIGENETAEQVQEHRWKWLDCMEQMAMLHDIGKSWCPEIISNASRRLEDIEFDVIRLHPERGWMILEKSNAPRQIREAVLYHHRWHNGRGGYPLDLPPIADQPLIDILSIADSLDAATDLFGRSYANPKSVEMLVEEFERDRDTRYGGFVIDALKDPEILEQVKEIIFVKRKEYICDVYRKARIKENG